MNFFIIWKSHYIHPSTVSLSLQAHESECMCVCVGGLSQFIDSIWWETAGLMSVLPEVRVCAVDCNQNRGPWPPHQPPLHCIIHYRQDSAAHTLISSFSFLVTDDSGTTNHPIKRHTILSQLTDIKRKEQRARRKVAAKIVRQKKNVNGRKMRGGKNRITIWQNPFQYWEKNVEALITILSITV